MTQLTPLSTDRFSYTNADMSGLVDSTSRRSVEAHIDSVLDCLWASDADHCLSYISPSLARATQGCCPLELGMKMNDWLSDYHDIGGTETLASVFNSHTPFRDHLAMRCKAMNDDRCSLLLSGTPQFDDAGLFLGFIGSITWLPKALMDGDRHRETLLQQELEKNFLAEHVMNAMSDPIFLKDKQLRFVLSNKAFAQLYGLKPADLVGKRVEELSDHVENVYYTESEQAVLDHGEMLEEEQHNHQGGKLGSHIVRKNRIETESGRQYMVGTLIDVTKLKQRSEELDAARARAQSLNEDLQKTLDSLTMGVVLLDGNGCLKTANSTYFKLWNLDREGIQVGDSFEQLIEMSRENGFHAMTEDDWANYKKNRMDEIRLANSAPREFKVNDGRVFHYSVVKLTGEQRLLSYLDVSEANARENALHEAKQVAILAARSKMDFLSSIGHDIRTPMNGIMGMAELLANSELNMRQRTFVDIIARSSQALMATVNDIIDFTRIDASTLELTKEPFSLRDIVTEIETILAHKAREKTLAFNVSIAPSVPNDLIGDKKRFRQILANLLGNAIKFTEIGSVGLSIDGFEDAGKAHLSFKVRDTGLGIEQGRLAGLFSNKDINANSADSAKSAIGLAIVGSLVKLMEGNVTVDSVVGEGSCFTVTLDFPVDANARFGQDALPVLEGVRILILDQDIEAHNCLSHHLKNCGADICVIGEATIGALFIEASQSIGAEIDLIVAEQGLIEHYFANVDSDDALRAFDKSKVLLMTDIDLALSESELMLQPNAGCLVKPIQTSLAIEQIIHILDRDSVEDEDGEGIDHHYITPPLPQSSSALEGVPDASFEPAVSVEGANHQQLEEKADNTAADDDAGDMSQLQEDYLMDVLIVEDNEINQLVYNQILSETALSFKIVSTGEALIKAFIAARPRLIMMDLSLPDMDGFELLQQLRNDHGTWGVNVPVVGVLTPANGEDASQCLEQGMDDTLSKPISPNALLQKILFWLERSIAQKVA